MKVRCHLALSVDCTPGTSRKIRTARSAPAISALPIFVTEPLTLGAYKGVPQLGVMFEYASSCAWNCGSV